MTGVGENMVRLVWPTLRTCGRGMILAVTAVALLPLVPVSLACVLLLPTGLGVVLAPKSLLAVRRQADRQRRWALEWSGVTIATPYRPRPTRPANRLVRAFRRCGWVLGDPATWRDLLWILVNGPVSVVLGLLPAFLLVAGTWTVVVDYGTLVDGWWHVAPHGFLVQVFCLSMLPIGVIAGPWLLRAHAAAASALLAPTRTEIAARVGQLTESRWNAVDASAAELRRIERDLHDGAQARLVALGLNIGLAEQMVRDSPDLALTLLAEARASSGQALSELRALVRGIHPPALAERGLDGAGGHGKSDQQAHRQHLHQARPVSGRGCQPPCSRGADLPQRLKNPRSVMPLAAMSFSSPGRLHWQQRCGRRGASGDEGATHDTS